MNAPGMSIMSNGCLMDIPEVLSVKFIENLYTVGSLVGSTNADSKDIF